VFWPWYSISSVSWRELLPILIISLANLAFVFVAAVFGRRGSAAAEIGKKFEKFSSEGFFCLNWS
jgi:hypothetical protein